MSETQESVEQGRLPFWKQRLRPLAAELSQTLTLRRELVTLEMTHDWRLLRRGVIIGGIGVVMAMTGLPMLLQAASCKLAAITPLSITAWSLILGVVFLMLGATLLARAIRKTRSGFCGLHGTLAELNEDLIWLREWAQSEDREVD